MCFADYLTIQHLDIKIGTLLTSTVWVQGIDELLPRLFKECFCLGPYRIYNFNILNNKLSKSIWKRKREFLRKISQGPFQKFLRLFKHYSGSILPRLIQSFTNTFFKKIISGINKGFFMKICSAINHKKIIDLFLTTYVRSSNRSFMNYS